MTKTRFGLAITTMLLYSFTGSPAGASYDEYYFDCAMLTATAEGKCPEKIRNHVGGPFNFGIWNNSSYFLGNVWIRARSPSENEFTEIGRYGRRITGGMGGSSDAKGVVFQFDINRLADKLNVGEATLKDGFEVRIKIESVGAGSGREDRCHPAEVTYDSTNQRWLWRKKDDKASWHIIADDKIYMWKVGGTVNDVSCGLKSVGGDKVSP